MRNVILTLPPDVQIGLFSATMPDAMLEVTKGFMRDPVKILLNNDQVTLDNIKQYYVAIEKESWKFDLLVELF